MRAQIGLTSTTSFELLEALLIYRADRPCAGTDAAAFVTRHSVQLDDTGKPFLQPGSTISHADLASTVQALQGALPMEFLPPNVLVRTEASIVWWSPATIRPMFYSKDKGKEVALLTGRRFPQPGLIFRANRGRLEVRAIAGDQRPEPTTPLFRAPYWNVNDHGSVCLGSAKVPCEVSVESLPRWENGFFQSEFTHPNGTHKLTEHPNGFIGLWKSLMGKRRFPVEHLADAKETLSHFINR